MTRGSTAVHILDERARLLRHSGFAGLVILVVAVAGSRGGGSAGSPDVTGPTTIVEALTPVLAPVFGQLTSGAVNGTATVALLQAALVLLVPAVPLLTVGVLRRVYRRGQAAGRARERQRLLRAMHDTVLQTLEAVAATAALRQGDPVQAAGTLQEIGRRASAEAVQLRHLLDLTVLPGEAGAHPSPPAGPQDAGHGAGTAVRSDQVPVRDRLRRLAEEFTGHGLNVELTSTDLDPDLVLPAPVTEALGGAVHEALMNVVKHAGSARVVVNAHQQSQVLRVTVRDYGIGFDLDPTAFGFGLRESVQARVGEAGGRCEIWSRAGGGTRITLEFTRTGGAGRDLVRDPGRDRRGDRIPDRRGDRIPDRRRAPVGGSRLTPQGSA